MFDKFNPDNYPDNRAVWDRFIGPTVTPIDFLKGCDTISEALDRFFIKATEEKPRLESASNYNWLWQSLNDYCTCYLIECGWHPDEEGKYKDRISFCK